MTVSASFLEECVSQLKQKTGVAALHSRHVLPLLCAMCHQGGLVVVKPGPLPVRGWKPELDPLAL